MPKQLRISIDNPCHVPWDGMTPVDAEQRHCSSCDRVITDFSKMSDDELVLYFRHSNGSMCGRFNQTQLNRTLALLPEKTQPARWWRMLLLLPLALFSKSAKAQYYQAVHPSADPDTTAIVSENIAIPPADSLLPDSTQVAATIEKDSLPTVPSDSMPTKELTVRFVPPPETLTITICETMGDVSIVLGGVGAPWVEAPPLLLYPPDSGKRKNEQPQIAVADHPENLSDTPGKKSDPPTPALPGKDLNAVLPEPRRRFWKS